MLGSGTLACDGLRIAVTACGGLWEGGDER